MIHKNIDELRNNSFSVIIVGSGPAGISTALKLEEKKIRTLILEAGSDEYSEESQEFYKSKIFGDQITDLRYSRLRQFGGTSGQWGGWSKPMENYNLSKWGIQNHELDKYSDQTSKILEIDNIFRKSNINKYFNQIEFQYSKVKFNEKFRNHISKSSYINLLMNAQVLKFSGEENLTKNVEFLFQGKKFKITSNFFILASGGIENSRILLFTKEQNNLLKNNSSIGMYWMTHPWFLGGYGVLKKKELSKYLGNNFINKEGPLHVASSDVLNKEKKIMSGSIYMDAQENKKIVKEIVKDLLCVAPNFGKKISRSIFKKDLKCGNIFMHLEETTDQNNRIKLDNKVKDSNGVPISNLYYKKSYKSLVSAKTILKEFADLCRKLDIGRIAIQKSIDDLKNYDSLGVYHHIGGTRIGTDIKNSVVDYNLKVHNNKNLYVVGSSVFPTSGYTNPTFTIVQLSLRLGDHISKIL